MAATVWKKAKDATIAINSVSYPWTVYKYKEAVSKFDATNILSGTSAGGLLADEHGVDTINTAFSGSFLCDAANLKDLLSGRSYAQSYTNAQGIVRSGFATVLNKSEGVATKGGYMVEVDGEFSGVVSNQ